MGFWISQEDLDGGARIDYDQEFATLEKAEAIVATVLATLGASNSVAFAIEDEGEEQLVFQFEPQGDDGLKPRRLVISAIGEPEHWAENWLES